ncbi:hypothetical protein KCU90_g13534, partial [Aureobasidium melanogenum]
MIPKPAVHRSIDPADKTGKAPRAARRRSGRGRHTLLAALLQDPCLQHDHQQQENPANHGLPVRRKADEPKPILEIQQIEHQSEQQHTGDRHRNRAFATGEQSAAEHHRRDREQFPADAFVRLSRAELRGEDDAGHAGEQAADCVSHHQRAVDVQAHQPRRFVAAADGQRMPPEARAAQREPAGYRRHHSRRMRRLLVIFFLAQQITEPTQR